MATINLDEIPTRTEITGYETETADEIRSRIPDWANRVLCPICDSLMVPIRAKKDNHWGETITYQCHAVIRGRACLLISTHTTSSRYFMRPEDFASTDLDYQKIQEETVLVGDEDTVQGRDVVEEFRTDFPIPPDPYKKNLLHRVIYNYFWQDFALSNGNEVDRERLILECTQQRPDESEKIRRVVDELPQWMSKKTGYLVSYLKNYGVFRVIGVCQGDLEQAPYNDPEYRKARGIPDPIKKEAQ